MERALGDHYLNGTLPPTGAFFWGHRTFCAKSGGSALKAFSNQALQKSAVTRGWITREALLLAASGSLAPDFTEKVR